MALTSVKHTKSFALNAFSRSSFSCEKRCDFWGNGNVGWLAGWPASWPASRLGSSCMTLASCAGPRRRWA